MKDNTNLKNVIEQQTQTIGELIQEKNSIKLQYENLIDWVGSNVFVDNSSNIIDNSSNIITSIIIDTSNII